MAHHLKKEAATIFRLLCPRAIFKQCTEPLPPFQLDGLKPQLAEEYAKQNRALAQKAEEIKQKTAEGTFEPDYVANSERAIESFQQINKDKQAAIKTAYDELDKLGAGKIEVAKRGDSIKDYYFQCDQSPG